MICHPALGEVIGADALVAHAGAHLAAAVLGDGVRLLLRLLLPEPGAEDLEGLLLVLKLAALILALHHHAGGDVGHTNGGGGLIDMLTAGAGGAEGVDSQILAVQFKLHLVHLWQDGDSGGGGMHPAAGFRLRHPLDPVDTALKLHPGVGAGAFNGENQLLHAPQLRLADTGDLCLPASAV